MTTNTPAAPGQERSPARTPLLVSLLLFLLIAAGFGLLYACNKQTEPPEERRELREAEEERAELMQQKARLEKLLLQTPCEALDAWNASRPSAGF